MHEDMVVRYMVDFVWYVCRLLPFLVGMRACVGAAAADCSAAQSVGGRLCGVSVCFWEDEVCQAFAEGVQ